MFTFSAALRFGKLSSPCILTLRLKRSLQTISTQKTLFVVSMASFPCFVCLSSLCLNYNDITRTTKVFCVYTEIGQGICGNLHKLVCVWKSTKLFRCLLSFFVLKSQNLSEIHLHDPRMYVCMFSIKVKIPFQLMKF